MIFAYSSNTVLPVSSKKLFLCGLPQQTAFRKATKQACANKPCLCLLSVGLPMTKNCQMSTFRFNNMDYTNINHEDEHAHITAFLFLGC